MTSKFNISWQVTKFIMFLLVRFQIIGPICPKLATHLLRGLEFRLILSGLVEEHSSTSKFTSLGSQMRKCINFSTKRLTKRLVRLAK